MTLKFKQHIIENQVKHDHLLLSIECLNKKLFTHIFDIKSSYYLLSFLGH